MRLKHIRVSRRRRRRVRKLKQRAFEVDVSVWYDCDCPYTDFDRLIARLTGDGVGPDLLWRIVHNTVLPFSARG